jgi:hypothetical protein
VPEQLAADRVRVPVEALSEGVVFTRASSPLERGVRCPGTCRHSHV